MQTMDRVQGRIKLYIIFAHFAYFIKDVQQPRASFSSLPTTLKKSTSLQRAVMENKSILTCDFCELFALCVRVFVCVCECVYLCVCVNVCICVCVCMCVCPAVFDCPEI